jgi:hypothetical protein
MNKKAHDNENSGTTSSAISKHLIGEKRREVECLLIK